MSKSKVRWGLIGCGDISRKRVAPALRDSPLCELVAVSRARAELVESFAHEFGVPRWSSDWHDFLMDYEIDAIYVATPVHLHAEQTIAAAERGKHVLCEKPMALSVADCNRMIAACRGNDVKLGIAYYRHFYPVVRRVKELVNSGELGVPVVAQINAFEWFDVAASDPRAWLIRRELSGGGPMFDFGCHRIEVLLEIFGNVRDVKATLANTFFDREVEDTATAVFQFERGTCGTLTVTHAAREPQDTFNLFCSQGSIHIPVLNEGSMRVLTPDGERIETHPNAKNIHQPLIDDFASAVLENRDPVVTGEIGRAVALVEEKVYLDVKN
ncbi:MAG TPA: Gfo/Idh/MocA family oxidoreductase [Pyrinomonadaceae bacterium]|nr:Gfo/Idh/MocA family oxidoreductase [Pyrinomonadaceae bacterium]